MAGHASARRIAFYLPLMAKSPKDPFPHQILLESKELPTIAKEFFKKFSEVQFLLF